MADIEIIAVAVDIAMHNFISHLRKLYPARAWNDPATAGKVRFISGKISAAAGIFLLWLDPARQSCWIVAIRDVIIARTAERTSRPALAPKVA